MGPAEEITRLHEAVDLCRSTIAEQERALSNLSGTSAAPQLQRLLDLYRDLLERQLARLEELAGKRD